MKVAITFHRVGRAFRRETVGLKRHSQRKAQRLLSKKTPDLRPENSSGDLKPHKPDSSSFSEAIRLAQQGDAEAFEIIYQRHSGRVYSTWLHRLTANLVLMHLRRKKPISISLDEVTGSDEGDDRPRNEIGGPDPRLSGLIDRLNLQRAIDQLPEGYRKIFVLYDVQGYEHSEIAKILGRSIGNSKSQLHKARKRLRELLGRARRCNRQENHGAADHPSALAASY